MSDTLAAQNSEIQKISETSENQNISEKQEIPKKSDTSGIQNDSDASEIQKKSDASEIQKKSETSENQNISEKQENQKDSEPSETQENSDSPKSENSSLDHSMYSLGSDIKEEKERKNNDYKEHLVGHLRELRKRIAVVVIVLAIGSFIFYPYSGDVIAYLWKTLLPENVIMSAYSPTEFIMTRLRVSVAFAIAAGFPILMYELFKFMSRGLYENERKFMVKVIPTSFLLFLFGAGLAYFLVLPVFMRYLIYYSDLTAISQISIEETINSIITLTLGFGGVFQVPLLMVIGMKMGIVEPATLKRYRYVVYGLLFSLAFFVSPDPTFFAQIIVGVLLVVLFEMSLILVRVL